MSARASSQNPQPAWALGRWKEGGLRIPRISDLSCFQLLTDMAHVYVPTGNLAF